MYNQEIRNWTSRRGIAEFRSPVELKGRVINSVPVLTCNIVVGGATGGATIAVQKGATRVGKAEEACDAWQVGTDEELGCSKNENTEKCRSGKRKRRFYPKFYVQSTSQRIQTSVTARKCPNDDAKGLWEQEHRVPEDEKDQSLLITVVISTQEQRRGSGAIGQC
ncbi:hypothetical protein B0H14DRAFT_2585794 [Mycena olivaceomarginata]|nr:hypothetical protein B0H14DRAFT_2585794 [Mycena olivaceomarginata]